MNKVIFKIFAVLVLAFTITSCTPSKDKVIDEAVSQLNSNKAEMIQSFGIPGATFEARNENQSLVCEFTIPNPITDEMVTAVESLPKSELIKSMKEGSSKEDIKELKECAVDYVFVVKSSANNKQAKITVNTRDF